MKFSYFYELLLKDLLVLFFYICGGCVATNPILKTDKLVKSEIQTEDNDVNNCELPVSFSTVYLHFLYPSLVLRGFVNFKIF